MNIEKFEEYQERNPLPNCDNDDTMRPEMQLLKAMAKFNHQERVAKTPDRIEFCKKRFEQEDIGYQLKSASNGHFHLRDKQGNLFQFWCSTGKIWYDKKTKEARKFKSFANDLRGVENVIRLVKGGK